MSFRTSLSNALGAIALSIASLFVSLLAIELVLRAVTPGVGFQIRNYTVDPINMLHQFKMIQYDPEVGYVNLPASRLHGFGRHSNRLHAPVPEGAPFPDTPRGAILAAGDSFTFGSDVQAGESWPAQLENMLGRPVVNTGHGGHGLDQAVLLVERNLEAIAPVQVVLSIIPDMLERVAMSTFSGAPKPFFVLDANGQLALRNSPVPTYRPSSAHIGPWRAFFGYFYSIAWAADRLQMGDKWRIDRWEHQRLDTDQVAVSCALLRRADAAVRARGAKFLVVGQYPWPAAAPLVQALPYVDQQRRVLACAAAAGIDVLDTFEPLRAAVEEAGANGRARFWVNSVGHMTPEGNRFTAQAIAARIDRGAAR